MKPFANRTLPVSLCRRQSDGLLTNTVIVSDDAGQFDVGQHGLCCCCLADVLAVAIAADGAPQIMLLPPIRTTVSSRCHVRLARHARRRLRDLSPPQMR